MKRLRIGVIFGSRSVEHEVSIVTAHQVMQAIDKYKYEVVPIYITKEGHWFTGEKLLMLESFKDLSSLVFSLEKAYIAPDLSVGSLVGVSQKWFRKKLAKKIDVAFPLVHGTYGEDGTLQGLLELANIPYVGAGVLGSALGMDKIAMKAVFKENHLPAVNYVWFLRNEWQTKQEEMIARIEAHLKYPLFVKPANLGSSIGISKAKSREDLIYAVEVASHYDRRLIVEESVENGIEINCSVLGNEEPIPSVCEQPVSWEEFLNYDEKYLRGGKISGLKGAERRIPAPITPKLTEKIQGLAVKAFKVVDCRGIARVDFLVNTEKDEIFINEINTIPGSISFYLWEATGIRFSELVERLIGLAIDAYKEKSKITYSYDSKLITRLSNSLLKK
ncbi:MAG: D-alanine--D-alanine ligase family protein [Thermodesulfovibrionales bacterium]|nr:D-alanine--D-alanine ligase family protein [Thermodesulfovibrionales bacterium]